MKSCIDQKREVKVENGNYTYVPQELSLNEEQKLRKLMANFPIGSDPDQLKKFLSLDVEKYDVKLLKIAVNGFDRCHNTMLGVAAEFGSEEGYRN